MPVNITVTDSAISEEEMVDDMDWDNEKEGN